MHCNPIIRPPISLPLRSKWQVYITVFVHIDTAVIIMKKHAKIWRFLLILLTVSAVSVVLCGSVRPGTWINLGRTAASLSAGMMQPQDQTTISNSLPEMNPSDAPDMSIPVSGSTTTNGQTTHSTTVKVTTPTRSKNSGTVVTEQLSSGKYTVGKVAIKNSAEKTIDIAKQFSTAPNITVQKNNKPQVLILHTHTTECYLDYDAGFYNNSDPTRTRDAAKNMVAVGEAIAQQLRDAGIGVIHDTTEHDYPQYNGAYTRSLATAQRIIKQYPSIIAVLDIHRDSIMRTKNEKIKPTVEIGGKKAAQLMILTSVSNTKDVPHPKWQENLRFSLQLQNRLNTAYEGLMRPLNLVGARYNQHLAPASLLLEVGSEVNTLAEAVYSGELFGEQFAKQLLALQK